ncbi:MAG TPA: DNA polymerase domain-containing protein [Chloroflexota bacterium]|nr:DNA polymerase domain-containing protein [Chloroflexota bacterium]
MTAPAISSAHDAWLFGWDPTPGIVSVWADRDGRARIWQRTSDGVRCSEDRFRPWLFAASLDDLRHLGSALVEAGAGRAEDAPFSFRELEGPPGSLRYLLSARDGRALQRAILLGAQRRLGPVIQSLRDLPNDYYTVGAVEQYLMATGRVYFRGMAYADLHRLQFDLETTALSPEQGRIFLVSVRDSHGLQAVLEAPNEADEAVLIADLCALIRARDPDVIENHNLFGFDLPFLAGRAATLTVPLALGRGEGAPLLERYDEPAAWGRGRRTRYSIAGRELVDTLDAVRRHDFVVRDMPGHGLKAAARYFGLAAPDRTYIPGPEIYRTYQRDPEQVRRYAFDDVAEVDGLSQRLMGAAFALAGMAPRRYERVASAGPATGILEPMLVRAYLRAGAALPANAAEADAGMAPHQGGATILYAAGVARHVVKADIASMYPSIMRTFRIGPASDSLQALLYLVDRLAELRLHHKRQARAAPPGSVEAQGHDALQAAMKIVINSAYGYMGAGRMAQFADRAAADEVTRRGREILGQVVERLRERGTALLEADTDGVFFAVPDGWAEADERACVAAVAATLPPGISLEYEGRYQAMLSHEVKNYALLTYDGRLIVRGAALHSSRSEPFGERFLQAALRSTLVGDVEEVQRAYLETIGALRERRFTPAEVATVARLTKSAAEYARTRERAREAAYEALLAAGRTNWRAGERVRFYRAADGTAIWLPDVPENDLARPDDPAAAERAAGETPSYDVAHYLGVLHTSYVSRLRKAFAPDDFEQLFRASGQAGLFDRPIAEVQPRWIQA